MTDFKYALAELREAIEFFDKVQASSADEKLAVGRDHWDWLEAAARQVAMIEPNLPPARGEK